MSSANADYIHYLVSEGRCITMTAMYRTDLAVEEHENLGSRELDGVNAEAYDSHGFRVEKVEILNENGANELCKPIGTYLTISARSLIERRPEAFTDGVAALSELIRELLPFPGEMTLIAGLGNPVMTPDSVGPLVVENVLATRHLKLSLPDDFKELSPVCAFTPGVLGSTGIESAELLKSVCDYVHPAQVIAVDALAAASLERLCTTVQLTDAGIVPGSGVGNNRAAVSRETLSVPVLALGVPTVVDAASFSENEAAKGMFVTPRDIDASVRTMSKLLGYSINIALHDGLTVADIDMLKG